MNPFNFFKNRLILHTEILQVTKIIHNLSEGQVKLIFTIFIDQPQSISTMSTHLVTRLGEQHPLLSIHFHSRYEFIMQVLTFSCFCFSLSRTDKELLTFFKSSTSTVKRERGNVLMHKASFDFKH